MKLTAQEIRMALANIFGRVKTIYSEADRILYIPSGIVEQLEKTNMLKVLGLGNECKDDSFFNSLRHQNMGKALRAFRI